MSLAMRSYKFLTLVFEARRQKRISAAANLGFLGKVEHFDRLQGLQTSQKQNWLLKGDAERMTSFARL